jgi:cell division protein ZapE
MLKENETPLQIYRQKLESKALTPDPIQEKAVQILDGTFHEVLQPVHRSVLDRLTKNFKKKDRIKSVYLYGGVGRGKSMIMDMFFKSLPKAVKKERVHFHAFMISLHDYLHEKRKSDEADGALIDFAIEQSKKSRVLCFDEFHVTNVADAMLLSTLFSLLWSRGVVTVMTSNWAPDRLYEDGLQRESFLPFIADLKENCIVFELDNGSDYRESMAASTLEETGVYFFPLGAKAQKKSDEAFGRLSEGMTVQSAEIEVKGRVLKIDQATNNTARFTFSQLCESPLGAEDYLRIAQRYDTVFLEKVPKLKYDRRNEAKRLMTLIDTLYDTQTNLVMTADAAADKLYLGHDHAEEFKRTVSRLLEMQSGAYLVSTS